MKNKEYEVDLFVPEANTIDFGKLNTQYSAKYDIQENSRDGQKATLIRRKFAQSEDLNQVLTDLINDFHPRSGVFNFQNATLRIGAFYTTAMCSVYIKKETITLLNKMEINLELSCYPVCE